MTSILSFLVCAVLVRAAPQAGQPAMSSVHAWQGNPIVSPTTSWLPTMSSTFGAVEPSETSLPDTPLEIPDPGPDGEGGQPDLPPDNSTVTDAPLEGADPTVNTANVLYCLDDSSVTYKVGLKMTFWDAVSKKEEGVQFFTSGLPFWCGYQFLKKHTNADGFYEDANLLPPNAGLNIGYNPTGKSMNFAGRYSTKKDLATVQQECQEVFQFAAGGNSYWGVYEDGFPSIPALLTPDTA